MIAPACGLAWSLTQAPFNGYAGEFAFIRENMALWITSTVFGILMSYTFIPAVLALVHLAQQRSAAIAYLGGSLACVGAAFHGSLLGFQLTEAPLVASGLSNDQLVTIAERLYGHTAFTVILMPVIGFYVGLVLLALAMWRSRVVKFWVPLLIIAGIAIEFLGPPAYKARIMFVFFLVAFGWIGVKVLRMGDSAWRDSAGLPAKDSFV